MASTPGTGPKVVILKVLLGVLALLLAMLLLAVAWGLLFGLPGRPPTHLGVQPDGRLAACPGTPNCVSSDAAGGYHAIAPLRLAAAPGAAMARLQRVLEAMPGMRIERADGNYLYATQRSRWLGFVDDLEFLLDPSAGQIRVRSASRLGRRDFGVNRARVEAIRAALAEGE
jgi:uncharacterized protein (DUF1499 family)